MRIINCVQGTPEWISARIGVATASCFGKLITPAKGDYSAQASDYEDMIVAEILTGESQEEFAGTFYTERGKELEPEAVAYYELELGLDVTHGGFVTNDTGTYGASPDGFAGTEGLIEIKCLGGKAHVGVVLDPSNAVKHRPQIQGQLLVTGRKWVDNLFYHPKLPRRIIRVERDEEYIAKLETALDTFTANVQKKIAILKGN